MRGVKKKILITGAGSGIGKATSVALAQRGHAVIATTETHEQARSLMNEMASLGLTVEVAKLDITLPEDRQLVLKYDLDVLINNAGTGESGSLAEINMDLVRRNFEVNVFSAFEISQLALRKMLERNQGSLIFISSLAGRIVMPFLGPYCMTKFALSSGAESLRNEIHRVRKKVHVCLIEPGGYHTGFNQRNIARKYEWMKSDSVFQPIMETIRKEEERQFRFVEVRAVDSIVKKIVRASEARKPRLRYSAPAWQAWGTQILRILGK